MAQILTIVRLILYSLPFVLVCLISTKLNLKKERRYKQVLLPVIALIYCVAGVVLLDNISTWVLEGIYLLIERFAFLSFLAKVNWAHLGVFVVNTALLVGFIFVKLVLFPIIMGLGAIPALADKLTGKFYYVSAEDRAEGKTQNRYLYARFGDARAVLRAMYYAMLAVFAFLMMVTYHMTSSRMLSAPFYPAFGIIVLGEIVAFLSGKLEGEKQGEVYVDPGEKPEPEVDYDTLTEKYKEKFEARILQTTHVNSTEKAEETACALLEKYREEYESTLCQEAALMYNYYGALASSGKVLEEAYLGQTRNLLDGKSVLFFTQFYNDTTDYVFLPVVRHLMKYQRVLVVLGNGGSVENVSEWFGKGISTVTGFESIWKIAPVQRAMDDTSVIVLDTKNIYNQRLLNEKAKLLSECTMVFVMEPSGLLGTMQIGLSCLVTLLRKNGNDPQYVIYDRNCDGLVDSLSHVLNKSLVQVNATAVGTAKKNIVFWKADGQPMHHRLGISTSRYLGVGTELALLALKEKVSKVVWASTGKFPVIDMRWIASQYYSLLCRIARLEVSQNQLDERISFVNDTNSIAKKDHSFIIAEDEHNNAFEAARQFATRGKLQSFVNVVSQQYWLREYMTDNADIFWQDPKSIPNITPDYQRSAGNVVYKLIIRMIDGPVEEADIRDTLETVGENGENVYLSLRRLVLKYFFRVDGNREQEERYAAKIDGAISISVRTVVEEDTLRPVKKRFYAINNKQFVDSFMSQLKIVYYVAEDEKNKDSFLDSAMYGHVYQKYLPGMLITLEGKSYEVISMTKNSGILVRRASDHINSREYYRTLRKYTVSGVSAKETVGSRYTHGGITVEHSEVNILVDTFGYLKMSRYDDIKNAKRVELSNVEQREYRNKECIRLTLADSTPAIRTTVATLLNELFVSVFPESYQYVTATTGTDSPEKTRGYIPELAGVDDECIYIIEDSLIDLGLLINVDRYLVRFLEIICDALSWHREKLASEEEPVVDEPADDGGGEGADDGGDEGDDGGDEAPEGGEEEKPKRKGLFGFIKGLFKGKKGKKNGEEALRSYMGDGVLRSGEPDDSGVVGDDSEFVTVTDGTIAANEEALPYSKSFFLLYGHESVPEILDLEGTEEYLTKQGFGDNYLKQTRTKGKINRTRWYNYRFEPGVHYCDFCGAALEGEFDLLDDGRERCKECSAEAITKLKDFKKLYKKTRKEMEKIFGIKLKAKIGIKMCNAEKIAAELGEKFVPSPQFDGRTLGFASRYGRSQDIFIENGAPAVESAKTLIHEMTHVWQYSNMPDLFEGGRKLESIEGMAVWAEVQYLVSTGRKERAEDYIRSRLHQNNEYGNGLRLYLEKYKVNDGATAAGKNPFACRKDPLN